MVQRELIQREIEKWQSITPGNMTFDFEAGDPYDFVLYVSSKLNIDIESILERNRKHEFVFARQLTQALAAAYSRRHNLMFGLKTIALATGVTNHSTVIYSMNVIYNTYQTKYEYGANFRDWVYVMECFSELDLSIDDLRVKSNYFVN